MRFPHPFRRMGEDHVNIIRAIITENQATLEWLESRIGNLTDHVLATQHIIKNIHPAHIDMSQELADAIVEKIHGPLTISHEVAEWIGRASNGATFDIQFPIGYSPDSGILRTTLTASGTMTLVIEDFNGQRIWEGTFREDKCHE